MVSLSIRVPTIELALLNWEFPNLREITIQGAEDFSIFKLCPRLEVIRAEQFNAEKLEEKFVFDDLSHLTNLTSFSLDAARMASQIHATIFKSLPKTLRNLKFSSFCCGNYFENSLDCLCNFTKLETLLYEGSPIKHIDVCDVIVFICCFLLCGGRFFSCVVVWWSWLVIGRHGQHTPRPSRFHKHTPQTTPTHLPLLPRSPPLSKQRKQASFAQFSFQNFPLVIPSSRISDPPLTVTAIITHKRTTDHQSRR